MRGLIARVRWLWRALRGRPALEADLDEELRLHVALRTEDLIRSGLAPAEAARRARVEFGGMERTKEEVRAVLGTGWLEEFAADARYGVRALGRNSAVAVMAILTLALGIGAVTVIYSLFDAAYLRALPYSESERLVALWQDHRDRGGPSEAHFNPPDYGVLRESSRTLERVAAIMGWTPTLTGRGTPERLSGRYVSHEYFDLFGATPIIGRALTPEDEAPGAARAVVISRDVWQRRLGGDLRIIGRTIELDGSEYTVVGVAPAGFRPPDGAVAVWRPLPLPAGEAARRFRVLDVVGRLAPGASLESARAELGTLAAGVAARVGGAAAGVEFRVASLEDRVLGPIRLALFALLAAVGLVLLVACANVAGLLLAHGSAREREFAVRASLGASRGRLVRQFLAEGFLIGVAGGIAGILIAVGGIRLLPSVLPADAMPGAPTGLTGGIAAGTLVLSLATAVAASLAPAIQLSGRDLARWLRGGGGGSTARAVRTRSALVVAEIALTLVLLVGAGLFLRNFAGLLSVDPGFRADNVLTADLSLPGERYRDAASVSRFHAELLGELGRVPGVRAAGATSLLPLRGGGNDLSFRIDGRATERPGEAALAWYRMVTPDYFRALGIPLVRGRVFGSRDGAGSPRVVLVNATLADRYWPDADPVGARVSPDWADGERFTVIGVVGDVRHNGLTRDAVPEMYFPLAQTAGAARSVAVVLETIGDPGRFAGDLRRVVWAIDPELPVDRLESMRDIVGRSIAVPRLHLWTFGTFAGLALLLAAVGLYGVVSTVVVQRTREIGVRMAAGARPADVMRWVLRWAAVHAAIGVAVGLGASLLLSRALQGLLYDLSPTDPPTFLVVTLVLVAVSLLAGLVPARRAAAVDPMVALRID